MRHQRLKSRLMKKPIFVSVNVQPWIERAWKWLKRLKGGGESMPKKKAKKAKKK